MVGEKGEALAERRRRPFHLLHKHTLMGLDQRKLVLDHCTTSLFRHMGAMKVDAELGAETHSSRSCRQGYRRRCIVQFQCRCSQAARCNKLLDSEP